MPTYEYQCPECGYETTHQRSIDNRKNGPPCPRCAVNSEDLSAVDGEGEAPSTYNGAPNMEFQISKDVSFRGTPTETFHPDRGKSELQKGNLPDHLDSIEDLEEDAKTKNQWRSDDEGGDEDGS